MAAEKYQSLKDFVESRCGARGGFHRGIRNRLTEIAVEEFPSDAADDKCLEVLTARMRVRIRKEYGSVVAMLIISPMALKTLMMRTNAPIMSITTKAVARKGAASSIGKSSMPQRMSNNAAGICPA